MLRRHLPLALLVLLATGGALEAQQSSAERRSTPAGERMATSQEEVFLAALRAVQDFALTPMPDSALWELAIQGLIQELNDPYATVLTRDEVENFEEESTGNYAGIGVQITELNQAVTITAVFRNTPADRAGLVVGDRIVGVDADVAEGWTVSDASSRIRGEPGTMVRVMIQRDGISQPIPHDIQRDQVHVPAVTSERIFGDIAYLHLDRVARNSAAEVDSVLRTIGDARGLVFDLRRNPGGYLDESLMMADLFLERGQVLASTKARTQGDGGVAREESAYARIAPRVPDLPIIVLVDQFSASAAEIVAGALQDHDRAVVLGERTFGKGTVQSVIPLPAGRLIRVTSGEWFTPLGRSLNRPRDRDGRVIEPDSIERFTSRAGRTLMGGGGVFPDVEVPSDTLSSLEQNFVRATVAAEIPLALRIQEVAFEEAQRFRSGTEASASIASEAFVGFQDRLVADGLDPAVLEPEVLEYLQWRLELTLFQRLDQLDRALEVQMDRDTALAAAVRMLQGARTQADLFAMVGAERERQALGWNFR